MSRIAATPVVSAAADLRAADEPLACPPLPRLGPWQLEKPIGGGTFTVVYRAHPAAGDSAQSAYAVKVLRQRWHSQPAALLRMRREAMIGRCMAHRHLVPVLASHVHRAPYYLVMPCLNGSTAAAHLAASGRIAVPMALWIARQVAEGLDALHRSGYLHGDVTASNILVARDGHATLIDLGSAQRTDEDRALDDVSLQGTPVYLAPEIFAGQTAGPHSDIYSLGVSLFQMLSGRLPLETSDMAAIAEAKRTASAPSLRAIVPQVPGEVARYVQQMMARQPLRRPHGAREVVQRLMHLEIATIDHRLPLEAA